MRPRALPVLSTVLALAALGAGGVRASNTLRPGSDATACRNMLLPGSMQRCSGDASALTDPVVLPDGQAPRFEAGAASAALDAGRVPVQRDPAPAALYTEPDERDVDQYLAEYGKPPRSAVRALLNPTDGNIAAMRSDQLRREIVAAYVAQRLTQIGTGPLEPPRPGSGAYAELPYFIGMTIAAYVPAECASCAELYRMLRQFMEQNPAVDLQLMVVGEPGGANPLSAMLDGGLPVPVSGLTGEQASARGISTLPAVEVRDTRNGRRRLLGPGIDAAALREEVAALRQSGLGSDTRHVEGGRR